MLTTSERERRYLARVAAFYAHKPVCTDTYLSHVRVCSYGHDHPATDWSYDDCETAAANERYAQRYVTTDSNGTPYCTGCGQPVTAHRGTTPRRLGDCPRKAAD